MRNPWRFSFDPVTDNLYLGHVGQDAIEWVNIVTNGANCGWNYFEGDKQWTNSLPLGFVRTPPLFEYGHTNGRNCIIGGIVYRGSRIPQLNGAYIYSDHSSGELWALRHSGLNVTDNSLLLVSSNAKFNAFGVDPSNGDVLGAAPGSGTNSKIQRLINTNPPPTLRITEVMLSGTNLVMNGATGTANQTYHLLASTNVVESSAAWPAVSTGLFDAAGHFSVTTSFDSNSMQRFYRLQVP
jgi:hypothetical protein